MKFELNDYHRNVTNEELISDLKKVASELKKDSVTGNEYNERGKYDKSTFYTRFGNWNKSLEKAGLKIIKNMNISEEELFQNLEEVWIRLGRQPSNTEVHAPLSKYSDTVYKRRFGGWRKALEKFVQYVNSETELSFEGTVENPKIESSTRHRTNRDVNLRLRFIVMRRDNFKCKSCGRSPALDSGIVLHVDHIKAWANGGETVLENLQTLCSVCNIGKSDLE